MDKRHDPCASHEVRILHPEQKTCFGHLRREPVGLIRGEPESHIDVGTQSRHAVGNHFLRTEDIPRPPVAQSSRQIGDYLDGSGFSRHGGRVPRDAREREGPRVAPMHRASQGFAIELGDAAPLRHESSRVYRDERFAPPNSGSSIDAPRPSREKRTRVFHAESRLNSTTRARLPFGLGVPSHQSPTELP